jgi:hypothetical protein
VGTISAPQPQSRYNTINRLFMVMSTISAPQPQSYYKPKSGGRTMLNCLISHGIVNQSGTMNKDKINFISGAVTPPFTEMVWFSSGGDPETINRLTSILTKMNSPNDYGSLFRLIQMLYGLLGLNLSKEALLIASNPKALEYFLHSFICDFGESMGDYLAEATQEKVETNSDDSKK